VAATLVGLLSGFEGSEVSTWGFLLPLTTLPTVEPVADRGLVGAAALALRSSRRSFDSSSLLDVPPGLLLEGRI
jgi:hypothetical protein